MLSERNYKELVRYRNGPAPIRTSGLSRREKYLWKEGFIEREQSRMLDSRDFVELINISYEITPLGEDALSEFETDHNEKVKKKRQNSFIIMLTILGVAVSIIAFIFNALDK